MKIREYEGVFYNSEDFDINGRPYADAIPVKNEDSEDIFKQDKILRDQMADDEQTDNDCSSSCDCLDKCIVLFTYNPNDHVRYDSYGFEIQDDIWNRYNKK